MILTQLLFKKVDLTMVLVRWLGLDNSRTDYPSMGLAMIGGIGGALVVFAVPFFDKLKIDDVGALSVHLVAGIWGTLAVGLFKEDGSLGAQIMGIIKDWTLHLRLQRHRLVHPQSDYGHPQLEEEEYIGSDEEEFGMHSYPEFVSCWFKSPPS